jgi:hypothetical protein
MSFRRNSAFSEPTLFPLRVIRAISTREKIDPEEVHHKMIEAWYNEINDIVHTLDDRHVSGYRNPGLLERLTDLRDDIYSELK